MSFQLQWFSVACHFDVMWNLVWSFWSSLAIGSVYAFHATRSYSPPIDHSKHSVGFTGLALWVYAALWVSGRVGGIRCGCFAWILLRRWVNSVAEQQPQQTNSSFQFAECGKVSLESFSRCLFELVEILQYLDFNRGDLWILLWLSMLVKHSVLMSSTCTWFMTNFIFRERWLGENFWVGRDVSPSNTDWTRQFLYGCNGGRLA